MSSEPMQFFYTSPYVRFEDATALLGADTNGAAPQRIYGFFVEGEISSDAGSEDVIESYWLKAVTSPDPGVDHEHTREQEFVAYADAKHVESILGAVATASSIDGYSRKLDGKFDGYHNTSQIEFNDRTSPECRDDLSCVVTSKGGAFHLKMLSQTSVVTSVFAKLSPAAVSETLAIVSEVREWNDLKLREIAAAKVPVSSMAV